MTKQELQKKLRANYNRDRWKGVLLEMFPEANLFAQDRSTVFTREEQRKLANHITQFGEVELDGDKLIFLEVELKPDSVQLTRNRVGLRKLVDNEVIAGLTDGALITYYQPETDEWRITFYSERYGWDEDGNTIKEETHPKRYTYVVGPDEPCKTAAGQLINVVQKGTENTLEHVLKAFSVQRVSKEFFKEYKEQYDKFVGYLTGKIWTKSGVKEVGERISQFQFYFKATTDHEKEARDFVKKLLGRIVFLYFVQKKQWLGADSTEFKDGKPDFIYDLFKQVPEDKKGQFYSQWLTKLFFDTLNRDDDHAFEMPDGSTVYIPFLNGGLFEKDETDHNTESLPLPGELFSNPEDTETPNTRGFLDFLSAYNFTIHEDSPGDHTIAVDPEMLGHIFENLLEDNKDKGAYYTPKPIVHYMCQESIIEYLLTELTTGDTGDSEKEDLRGHLEDLIKKQEAGELVGFTEQILKSLKEVKVCDPAIGSGAFPMGILQEIYQAVETLHHLSPDNVKAIWELPDDDWHPAEVKKQIIQNSIYGVDIEKGAVDIARLRFWLSLIVDEKEPTALPNLDYKIVVGDSLLSRLVIDEEEQIVNINWEMEGEVGSTKEHLKNLKSALNAIVEKQKKYFNADTEEKEKLKNKIDQLKIEALIHQLHFDREDYVASSKDKGNFFEENTERKLKLIGFNDLIENLKSKIDNGSSIEYFDWNLNFPEILNSSISGEKGFDILIANPPYVGQKGNKSIFEPFKDSQRWKSFYERKQDLYYYFIAQGIELLKNDSGVLTYINPPYFLTALGAKNLRKFIVDRSAILKIIDLSEGQQVFENVSINSLILFLGKSSNRKKEKIKIYKPSANQEHLSINSFVKRKSNFSTKDLSSSEWYIFKFGDTVEIEESNFIKLEDVAKISPGIQTGSDKVKNSHIEKYNLTDLKKDDGIFVMSNEEYRELNFSDEENEFIKPFFKNSQIEKWITENSPVGKIIITNEIDDIDKYPNIKNHLNKYREILDNRYRNYALKNADKEGKWWYLYGYRPNTNFESEKIVLPYRSKTNTFAYSNSPLYASIDINYIEVNSKYSTKFILGILCSRLIEYWLQRNCKKKGKILELYQKPLSKIPICKQADPGIADLVDQILTQKEANPEADTTALEQQIDTLVYKLYNLTWEEVQVVDPEFELSEEEYEAVEVDVEVC